MKNAEFEALRKPIAIVVDDEPLILMSTSDIIAHAGYSIVEAMTADEAYAFLNEHSSGQLVVTDVQMPGKIDGFELARNVSECWPDICVVVASAPLCRETATFRECGIHRKTPFSRSRA